MAVVTGLVLPAVSRLILPADLVLLLSPPGRVCLLRIWSSSPQERIEVMIAGGRRKVLPHAGWGMYRGRYWIYHC
jgi:hypothetical protein